MTNIYLFIGSVILYYVVYEIWWFTATETLTFDFRLNFKALGIIALLCLPVNIGGHVFTVLGNAQGKNGVYSVASLYQESESGDTLALFSSGYQRADGDATTCFGFSAYKDAGRDAAVTVLGISAYERGGRDAIVAFGVSGYQQAERHAGMMVGIPAYQRSEQDATNLFGVSGYQHAENQAVTFVGLALYQRVQDATRAFGVLTPLRGASYKESY